MQVSRSIVEGPAVSPTELSEILRDVKVTPTNGALLGSLESLSGTELLTACTRGLGRSHNY